VRAGHVESEPVDLIPVATREELVKFGLDYARFAQFSARDRIGGKEWHGPCPFCGGTDRFQISNGMYYCRQCDKGGSLLSLGGQKCRLSDEERLQIQLRAQEEERRKADERKRKLAFLNQRRMWQVFHRNLLARPELFHALEKDGITREAVEQFQIGYHPSFRFLEDGTPRTAPAFTFPIFSLTGACANIRCRILGENVGASGKYRPIYRDLGIAFLLAEVEGKRDLCFYVEGEKKAINFWGRGQTAIGLWGIHTWKETWIPWFKRRYRQHVVIFDNDNDEARRAALTLASWLGGVSLDLGGKPDDLLNQGRIAMDEIVRRAQEKLLPW
jgi:DNA primase